MEDNSKGFVRIILIVILLLLVCGAAYYFGATKGSISFGGPETAKQSPQGTSTPNPSANLTATWKTFTTKDGKYFLKYPSDWSLTDNSKNVDLYGDGKIQFQQDITISKDGYKFTSRNPLAWGPGVCLFPDSPPFDGPSSGIVYDNYTQISGVKTIFRRIKMQIPPEIKKDYVSWGICSKEANSNTYTSVVGFGTTGYQSPLDYNEETIQLMDGIMASFKPL